MTALEAVWEKALEEYQELKHKSSGSKKPRDFFCLGYMLGCAYGLALSTVRSDLVQILEPLYRERGWLQEPELVLDLELKALKAAPSGRRNRMRRPGAHGS